MKVAEQLIMEIKKYPELYDTTDERYKDRNARNESWKKVVENVLGVNFMKLDSKKRNDIVKDLQRKWKTLRDTFIRSLKSSEVGNHKNSLIKRPYYRYKLMSFLLPYLRNRGTIENTTNTLVKAELCSESPNSPESSLSDDSILSEVPISIEAPQTNRINKETLETQLLPILKDSSTLLTKLQDEDLMFFLSILPKMKRLNASSILDFQIKCMQLLQTYLNNPNCMNDPIPSSSIEVSSPQQDINEST